MKFHVIHYESGSHFEVEASDIDVVYDMYPNQDIYVSLPWDCPACKRGEELE